MENLRTSIFYVNLAVGHNQPLGLNKFMIHRLAFSNFYSFKNKVEIDFVVDKHAPETDAYFTDEHDNRVSKIMTVVGANASGKSNLLRSLSFLKWFITDSFSLDPKSEIDRDFEPFLFCSEKKSTNFELVFEIESEIYQYILELTKIQVVTETLKIKNNETKKWNIVFDRSLKKGTQEYELNFTKLDVPTEFEKLIRANASVLSTAKLINNLLAVKLVDYFSKIQSSFDNNLNNSNKKLGGAVFEAAKFFHSKPEIKEKAEKILRRFDLGISKLLIEKFEMNDGKILHFPMSYHKFTDSAEEAQLSLFDESGGTRNLFVILKDILAALETGDIVVFDELDNNLHPLMIPELVNLFRSENYNPKHAQILFSTHNAQILNELDKQQIVIVEKDDMNISSAWKLSDIEGVRSDDNYYAKYMAGFYGGVPKF